ncbi:MAG: polysulfide reductase NrfD [Candidatus Aminicenantes bacterium]|nr:polysulfide reductase NrfD [Candidatus Aminicenantes bacterium]
MNITEWGIFIALDFFWGGMAVGTYIFSILFKKRNNQLSRLAAYISPVCLLIAMIFLVGHLGKPLNSIWVLLSFNFTSIIAWGSLFQGIFLIISILHAFMVFKNSKTITEIEIKGATPSIKLNEIKLGYIGLPFALLIGIYHGYLLMSLTGRPLWNSGLLPILSVGAFITTGIALVMVVSKFSSKTSELNTALQSSHKILITAIIFQFFAVLMWVSSLWFGGVEKKDAVIKMFSNNVFSFWIMALFIGLIIPIILWVKDVIHNRKTGYLKFTHPIITSIFVLIGAFFLRYVIIIAGQ